MPKYLRTEDTLLEKVRAKSSRGMHVSAERFPSALWQITQSNKNTHKNTHNHKKKTVFYAHKYPKQQSHTYSYNSLTNELFGSSLRTKTVLRR